MNKTVALVLMFGLLPLWGARGQDEPVAPAVETTAQELPAAAPQVPENPPQEPGVEPLVYENTQAGIRLAAPASWLAYKGIRRHPEILVMFTRFPYESRDADNPKIVLVREPAGKNKPDSVLALAFRHAEVVRLMRNLKDKVANTILLEEPSQEPGKVYARLAYEITSIRKDKTQDLSRSREYIFRGADAFYVLLCGARPEFFERHRADFDAAADKFTVK